ncbi:hypothetical protein EDD15DRAFT_2190570 [Pisolithus albus]|nr:hypothetical protein EDD15DRAFT_2190570 [Pisolithus albus]
MTVRSLIYSNQLGQYSGALATSGIEPQIRSGLQTRWFMHARPLKDLQQAWWNWDARAHLRSFDYRTGLTRHPPSVFAVIPPSCPIICTHERRIWYGGTWICWGDEHRDVTRATHQRAHSPQTRNYEVKTVDGTANPHLVLAGLISAGIFGIRDQLELTVVGFGERSGAGLSEVEGFHWIWRAQGGICWKTRIYK